MIERPNRLMRVAVSITPTDEKPQIQALERTQKILPLRPGMPEGMSNDYKRNGTIDLYAALNILDGTVVTQLSRQNTHREFLSFLNMVDDCVEHDLQVHVVADNLRAHGTPEVKRCLKRHVRFTSTLHQQARRGRTWWRDGFPN